MASNPNAPSSSGTQGAQPTPLPSINFGSLPKRLRDTIYRMHLLSKDPILVDDHVTTLQADLPKYYLPTADRESVKVPRLLRVSKQVEKEAAPIFYGENAFEGDIAKMLAWTRDKHVKLIKVFIINWPERLTECNSIIQLEGLQELRIRVDEKDMIERATFSRLVKCAPYKRRSGEPNRTQMTAIRAYPGMDRMCQFYAFPRVEFIQKVDGNRNVIPDTGPLADGVLLSYLRKLLMDPTPPEERKKRNEIRGPFKFLDLSGEMRNRIYDMIFVQAKPVKPSRESPMKAIAHFLPDEEEFPIASCLAILETCKLINDEAYGIFYKKNDFQFDSTIDLQGFLMMTGQPRQKHLRSLEFTYTKIEINGRDTGMTGNTMLMLRGMPQLRRLVIHVNIHFQCLRTLLKRANLCTLPGMTVLFELRGLETVLVDDVGLTGELERPNRYTNAEFATLVKMKKAHDFFNAAVADAQVGKVNRKLLTEPRWHLKAVFPAYEAPKPPKPAPVAPKPVVEEVDGANSGEVQPSAVPSRKTNRAKPTVIYTDGFDLEGVGNVEDDNDSDYVD